MVLTTNNAGKTSSNAGPTASHKRMKNMNNNSQTGLNSNNAASGKNMRSMSLSKRLAMAAGAPINGGNNTIDLSMLGANNTYQTLEHGPLTDLNNKAMLAQQFNTLVA